MAEQLEEELQERLAEMDEEEPPEIEEEEEEEDESEALDRMKSSLSEQYQECVEQISQIQVFSALREVGVDDGWGGRVGGYFFLYNIV